jgi:tRNA-N(6)-(isopentenyl)adenosine-37 thiotransferase enzyme MiaB
MRKVYIRTFGCQMNTRDSEYVAGLLVDKGFRLVKSSDDADVILFNSCSVRKHAEDRVFGNIGELKHLKKAKPDLIIGLMGCTAQAYQGRAIERSGLIDIVCGTGNEADLPRLIVDMAKNRNKIVAVDKMDTQKPERFPKFREGKLKATVSIGEGCNNFCSYCIVPYVRGKERSRDAKDIIREVRDLASRGFKEILLLGQNVNSYKAKCGKDFIRILEDINKIKGIERIRFMTSHPKDAHVELFTAMRDLERVCEHIHLPIQSGSDRILKLMNRKYTVRKYLKLVDEYKRIVPHGSITTDIIIGFPSETAADHKKTCDIMRKVAFDSSYTFKYSPRPPARSAALKDDVSSQIKEERLESVMDIQRQIGAERNECLVGATVEVLVESPSKKDPSELCGKTRTVKNVVFKGKKSLIGKIVKVQIETASSYALKGRLVR